MGVVFSDYRQKMCVLGIKGLDDGVTDDSSDDELEKIFFMKSRGHETQTRSGGTFSSCRCPCSIPEHNIMIDFIPDILVQLQ